MKCNFNNVRKSDIYKIKKQATQEVFELLLAVPVSVLFDKFGFTPEQLEDFAERVLYLFDSFQRGYVSIESLRETLAEEAGIKFINDKEKNHGRT